MRLREILLLFLLILIPTCLANPLPYWIEDLPNGSFNIWTKVNISAKGTIHLIIKKEPGYSPNGDAVFLFFDDFNDGLSKWKYFQGAHFTTENINGTSVVVVDDPSNSQASHYISIKSFSVPFIVYFKAYLIVPGMDIGFSDADGNYQALILAFDGGGYDEWWGSDTQLSITGCMPTDKWEWGEMINLGSKVKIYRSWTNNWVTEPVGSRHHLIIGLINWGKGEGYFDYIFVCKYANQSPVVNISKISTNTWLVTIYNPNNYDLKDFQVNIPGTGIVTSKADSLYISLIPEPEINYYRSIGGYTLTVRGNLGNVSVYLDSKLLYTGEITTDSPYQKTFIYDISSYPLKIIYYDYGNLSMNYKINSVVEGNYTLSLIPVGNYTNESFYPLIITISGKSYWISSYKNIPLNVSITAYKDTPISITTSLGEEISVPAEDQKVPIFFTTTYSQIEAKTLQGHILEFKSKYGIVGYGQDINIKVPTGLVITPYLDNFPLQPITVSQNLNLFYSPSLIQREIYAYQTIDGKIVVSIKSLLPANFTVLIKGENNTIYLNQSVIPGIYKFNYPNTNQSVILEVLVNNKVALSKTLVPPGEINSWDNLGDLTKIAILFILAAILAIVYLSSGLSAALGLTLAGSLILLLPIPDRLKPILAATVFLSIMLYLYLRRW